MKKRLLMIGGWPDIYKYAHGFDFSLTLFHERKNLKSSDFEYIEQFIDSELADKSIVDLAIALHQVKPFDAVVSFQELGVLNAALIADKLDIEGNHLGSVLLTRDKLKMRMHMDEHNLSNIAFEEINTVQELEDFGTQHGYPFILKPSNGVGSIQVHKVTESMDKQALLEGIFNDPVFKEVTVPDFDKPKLIAEVFLDGPEISVEAVTWKGEHCVFGFTDKILFGGGSFVELGHKMPAKLDAELQQEITQIVKDFLTSIGHYIGPSHTEFKLTSDGPKLIESHTRTGGDQIFEMTDKVYGIDMIKETLRGLSGAPFNATPQVNGGAAIQYIGSEHSGVIKSFSFDQATDNDKQVERLQRLKQVGDDVDSSCHSAARLGYALAYGNTADHAHEKVSEAVERVVVEIL